MELDALVRRMHHLLDLRNHADLIQILRRRFVLREIGLRDDKDQPICIQRSLDRENGFLPADVKLQHHARKHDKPAYSENRHCSQLWAVCWFAHNSNTNPYKSDKAAQLESRYTACMMITMMLNPCVRAVWVVSF